MSKVAFLGFGEVNTPVDVIVRKCSVAEAALKAEGLDLVSVYPIADDYEEYAELYTQMCENISCEEYAEEREMSAYAL